MNTAVKFISAACDRFHSRGLRSHACGRGTKGASRIANCADTGSDFPANEHRRMRTCSLFMIGVMLVWTIACFAAPQEEPKPKPEEISYHSGYNTTLWT